MLILAIRVLPGPDSSKFFTVFWDFRFLIRHKFSPCTYFSVLKISCDTRGLSLPVESGAIKSRRSFGETPEGYERHFTPANKHPLAITLLRPHQGKNNNRFGRCNPHPHPQPHTDIYHLPIHNLPGTTSSKSSRVSFDSSMSSSNPSGVGTDAVQLTRSFDSNNSDKDKSAKSNDSRNYDGVYYGSSDDDDLGVDADATRGSLLGDVGEPKEREEPYDILADNGEFLYSEQDRRKYISTVASATPSAAAMDLMLSSAEGVVINTMLSISEDDEEAEDEGEADVGEARREEISTPKKSNKGSSDQREIVFRPKHGINLPLQQQQQSQNRSDSPPTPMYQLPKEYNVQRTNSVDSEQDYSENSEDDQSASDSILTGSIRKLVNDIKDGLKDNSGDSNPQRVTNTDADDATIASEVDTTGLSGELERAQEVFWEFSGIDATGAQKKKKAKKMKKQEELQEQRQQEAPIPEAKYRPLCGTAKRSTILILFLSYALFLGILVWIFLSLRMNKNSQTETSVASSIANDLASAATAAVVTTGPTLSPVEGDASAISSPSESNGNAAASAETVAPSNSPTQRFWLPVTMAPSRDRNKISDPTLRPTPQLRPQKTRNPGQSGRADEENDNLTAGEYSFQVPNSADSIRPWDDDDITEGHDDFYSNDDAYEYNLHHSQTAGAKSTKEGKHHGTLKASKASKGQRQRPYSVRVYQYKQQMLASQWSNGGSPMVVQESVRMVRRRRSEPRGY